MHVNHVEFTNGQVWRIVNNIPVIKNQGFFDLLNQYTKVTDEPTPQGFCTFVKNKLGTGVTAYPEGEKNGHGRIIQLT